LALQGTAVSSVLPNDRLLTLQMTIDMHYLKEIGSG